MRLEKQDLNIFILLQMDPDQIILVRKKLLEKSVNTYSHQLTGNVMFTLFFGIKT